MPEYDVIVAGGGISGLMSALTLSKHGKRVLVLEKTERRGATTHRRWLPYPFARVFFFLYNYISLSFQNLY
ncbi:MAG: FAD-dependent oxidoreductase [Candidatus Methanoperedens sp.]